MRHFTVLGLTVAMIILAGASFAQERTRIGDLVIELPWARASIGTGRPAAAYLTIHNQGAEDDILLAVRTSLSGMAEIHIMRYAKGVIRMGAAGPVRIPAKGTISLAPGGLHIMMMKLKAPLVKGENIAVTLTFERAGEITVTAPILGPGATRSK